MTIIWSGRDVTFQRAVSGQVTDVLSVLDEAASWLHAHGIDQWPARVEAAWVGQAIAQGETWLVLVSGDIATTLTLDWSDTIWSDIPGIAGYLHRMAVRRWAAGLGGVLLRWAADATLAHGRSALRLDCVASNGRLRAYYEAAGVRALRERTGRWDSRPATGRGTCHAGQPVPAALAIDSLASGSCEGARALAPCMARLRPTASAEAS